MKEQDIIRYFCSQHQQTSIAHGIGDDGAVINTLPEHQLVVTTDTMVEGHHFVTQSPAFLVGFKLMACNISDIAAMCAIPKWATLNITLADFNAEWINEFAAGLKECAQQHDIVLVGGDTTRGTQLVVSLQLIGEVPTGKATLRNQAQLGDAIYVTGEIGQAAEALKCLQRHDYQHSMLNQEQMKALYQPESRLQLALDLRQYINASIDISDGLLHELELICENSFVGAVLNLDDIPIEEHLDVMTAITSGDDYELLFTANSNNADAIFQLGEKHDCHISMIGNIRTGNKIEMLKGSQVIPYPNCSGFDHFMREYE